MAKSRPTRLSAKLRRAPTRYEPVRRIAAGGMAEVWKARAVLDTGESYFVAIKRVLPELSKQELYRSMFEDEARLGMLLRHPNVVRVYDARDVAGTYLMIMELVDGTSLKSLLDRAHDRRACVPVAAALHVTRQLALGLDYAHLATDARGQHLGIVHRDVSPHNVLLSRSGAIKLADFGLANARVNQTMRTEDLVGGKLGYLAPETVLQKPTDHRVDVFAVGIVLWEMLAGRRLFYDDVDATTVRNVVRKEIEPVSKYNSSVTPEVDALVRSVLDRNPDKRVASARALVEDVDRVLAKLDPRVGARDVSLLVGLHLAGGRGAPAPRSGLDALAGELDAFVTVAGGVEYDLGAEPLDPSQFGRGPDPTGLDQAESGVRPMPNDEEGGDPSDWYDP
jgi:serine/threonine-protein kinase